MSPSLHRNLEIFTLLLMAAAGYFSVTGGWECIESVRASRWPTTDGQVLDAHYSYDPAAGTYFDLLLGTKYDLWIAYRYSVRGQEFIGHRINYGFPFHEKSSRGPHHKVQSTSTVEELVERFPEGRHLRVSYDPERPSDSVLETGMIHSDSLALVGGPVILILGLFFFLKLRRTPVEEEKAPVGKAAAQVAIDKTGEQDRREEPAGEKRVLKCSSCGAPMRPVAGQPYFECEHCSTVELPEKTDEGLKVLGEIVEAACPVCALPLVSGLAEGAEVYYCKQCRGMLVPMGRFEILVSSLRARYQGDRLPLQPLDRRALKRQLDCPACRKRLETHPYLGPGSVVVDTCQDCSLIWLDHGELTRIVRS